MSKPIQHISMKFLFIAMLAAGLSNHAFAGVQEDSCRAAMNITPDQLDPLLLHFEFTGSVPVGSFQFLGIWDFGDGNLSTDSCPVHLYAQPGTYLVCLSFSICIGGGLSCHDDTCISISIGTIDGISDPDGKLSAFYTYPNPVQSTLHVRSNTRGEFSLVIKNLTGQMVYSASAANDQPVDVAALPNGVYFVEVADDSRKIQRKIVIGR